MRPAPLLLAAAPLLLALPALADGDAALRAFETGLQIDDLRYYGSQSWPFPHSLMVAYTARWTGQEASNEVYAFYQLNLARSVDEAFEAVKAADGSADLARLWALWLKSAKK